jgi:hypothetical protein
MLLYVLGALDKSDSAHDVVAVFDAEYFPDLFWDGYSSACDYFCEEGNVFFLDLNRQLLASGQMAKNPMI